MVAEEGARACAVQDGAARGGCKGRLFLLVNAGRPRPALRRSPGPRRAGRIPHRLKRPMTIARKRHALRAAAQLRAGEPTWSSRVVSEKRVDSGTTSSRKQKSDHGYNLSWSSTTLARTSRYVNSTDHRAGGHPCACFARGSPVGCSGDCLLHLGASIRRVPGGCRNSEASGHRETRHPLRRSVGCW